MNIEKLQNTLRLIALSTSDDLAKALCLDVLEESEAECKEQIKQTCWVDSADDLRAGIANKLNFTDCKLISFNNLASQLSMNGIKLEDEFFITKKRKLAFLLKRHEKGFFDKELGIKRKHYIDKSAAKEWKIKLAKEFHPDKNLGDTSLDFAEITQCINKIYSRMVGKP